MPRGRNDNDDSILKAQNDSQLELIKLNVEKVKKDVSDVSIFTKKEIDSVVKKIDQLIARIEKSNKSMAKQNMSAYEFMAASQDKLSKEQEKAMQKQIAGYVKYANEVIKSEKEMQKQREESAKQQEEIQKQQQENTAKLLDTYQQNYQKILDRQSQQKESTRNAIQQAMKGDLSDIFLMKNDMRKQSVLDQMDAIKTAVGDGKLSAAAGEKQMSGLLDQMKGLDASAAKIKTGAQVFQIAADGFKKVMNNWLDRFKGGMDKIIDTYESTFQAQAVQTQISEDEYFDKQRDMQDSLNKQGLQNNIAITDVMQATADFTKSGITNMTQAMSMGEQSAISKVLAPYLDTQSDAFISMSQTLGPQFSKSLIGVSKYVSDNVGSNRFIQKNMNQIISMMEPIVMASNKQIMGDEEWAQMEALMNNGYTESEALALVSEAMDTIRNPSGAMDNGTTLQAMQVANGNYKDISKYISGKLSDTANLLSGTEGLGRSAASEAIGAGYKGYLTSDEDLRKQARIAAQYAKEDALTIGGATTSGSSLSYEQKLINLANDQYTTALSEKEILAQSLSLEAAIAQEKWPDLMSAIRAILPGIAQLFMTWIGGKLLGKFLGLGGGKGGLLSNLGKGAGKHAATSTLGSITSNIAANGGLGATTGLGATLTAAGGIAGIAGGIYGVAEGNKDIKRGKTARGVTSTIGGAAAITGGTMLAGGVAASALGFGVANAWNPVGWVTMAAGLAAVGITAIHRATDTSVDLSQELEAEKQAAVKKIKDSNNKTIDQMYDVREAMKKSNSYEEAKQIALQNNIIKQEELDKATDKSINGLLKLADVSIQDQKDLNDIGEQTASIYEDIKNEQKEKAGNDILGLINTAKAGGRTYDDLSEDEKQKINSFMQEYIKANENSDNEDIKWRIKQWGSAFDDSTLSKDDFNKIMDGDNGTSSDLFESFVSSDSGAKRLSQNGNLQGYYGGYYSILDSTEVDGIIKMAISSKKIEDAKTQLEKLKMYNMPWDRLPDSAKNRLTDKFGDDIKSYAVGSEYVPMNGQLAYLHEGEAVLTKTAADILRSQTSASISTAHGVSSALSANSSMSTEHIASIVTAISNQTMQLIQKMDQIINSISAGRRISPYDQSMINLGSSKA